MEQKNIINFNSIVEYVNNNFDIKLVLNKSLGMKEHINPCSITEKEANKIKDTIIENNLTRGFEVATAFGISAFAAGLGMKETNGKLISMDCYIEEHYNACNKYTEEQKEYYKDADGYKLASFLINSYDIPVNLEVGFSPIDTFEVLNKHYNLENEKLDYVMIDALHTDKALLYDFDAIFPYMSKDCILMIHDKHCFSTQTIKYIEDKINKKLIVPFENNDKEHYYLAISQNI